MNRQIFVCDICKAEAPVELYKTQSKLVVYLRAGEETALEQWRRGHAQVNLRLETCAICYLKLGLPSLETPADETYRNPPGLFSDAIQRILASAGGVFK
jgi:hypothetical protein